MVDNRIRCRDYRLTRTGLCFLQVVEVTVVLASGDTTILTWTRR